jgi:hypothetical protein
LKFDDPNTSSFGGKYFLMFVGKKDPKNWILIATNEKEPCSKLNKFCNLNQQSSFAEYMKENRCGTTELLEVNVNGIYVTKHQLKWPIMTDTLEGDAYLFSGKNVGVLIGGSDSKIVENFVKSVKFEDAIKIEDVPEATTETIKLLHEYIDIRLQDVQHLFLGLGNKYGEEFHYGYAKKGPYGVTDYGFKASVWAEHVCPKEVKMVEEWRYFKKDDRVLTILALSYDPRVTYETIQKKVDSFKP